MGHNSLLMCAFLSHRCGWTTFQALEPADGPAIINSQINCLSYRGFIANRVLAS